MPSEPEPVPGLKEVYGMRWVSDFWNVFPQWTVDLDAETIERICRDFFDRHRSTDAGSIDMVVKFLDQGDFNRVYVVDAVIKTPSSTSKMLKDGIFKKSTSFKLVFRVTMPVDPRLKSLSEVATINFLNNFTKVPVASVLDSTHTDKNPLRFEWMLQAFSLGRKLTSCWQELGHTGRTRMIEQLAGIQLELFNNAKFKQIGSIYHKGYNNQDPDADNAAQGTGNRSNYEVGKLVSLSFIMKMAGIDIANRGPYQNTAEWMCAQLDSVLLDCDRLAKSSDEYDLEAADVQSRLATRLLALVPKIFPSTGTVEETFLIHSDLNEGNIFCDEDGNIISILDWEFSSCLPLWTVYSLPRLLQGQDLHKEPFSHDFDDDDQDYFQQKLVMWQSTKLKEVYLDTMARIWPDWIVQYNSPENKIRQDLRIAVDSCDNEHMWGRVRVWLDGVENVECWSNYVPLNLS